MLAPSSGGWFQEERHSGRRQVHRGWRRQGWGVGEESGRKYHEWFLSTEHRLAGGLWASPLLADTQSCGHSLAVSNCDKWHGEKWLGGSCRISAGSRYF